MATLQAARAKALGLPVASAKSWGLNRAIYYAAAKRGFKGGKGPAKPKKYTASFGEFYLGDDKAYQVKAGRVTLFNRRRDPAAGGFPPADRAAVRRDL